MHLQDSSQLLENDQKKQHACVVQALTDLEEKAEEIVTLDWHKEIGEEFMKGTI